MARPKKYNPLEISKIIEVYTKNEDIPIFKEVCYLNKWNWKYMYELANTCTELSDSIKMLMQKKEVQLEKLGLYNVLNSSVAIFSLKQLGWKDKQEIAHSIDESVLDKLQKLYESK